MFRSTDRKRVAVVTTSFARRLLAVSVLAIALTAGGFALASPAKATFGTGGSPFGTVDNIVSGWSEHVFRDSSVDPGHVSGYAVDPDWRTSPISVRVDITWTAWTCLSWYGWSCTQSGYRTVNSVTWTLSANLWYASLYGTINGPYHGFNVTLPTYYGAYDHEYVTVTAVNIGIGSDTRIGSAEVVMKS